MTDEVSLDDFASWIVWSAEWLRPHMVVVVVSMFIGNDWLEGSFG